MSNVVHRWKQKYSAQYRRSHRIYSGRLWQHRFWDHIIRDENDFERKFYYIHYNPVRHGLVDEPFAWKWSSIHRWYDQRTDSIDFDEIIDAPGDEFGE